MYTDNFAVTWLEAFIRKELSYIKKLSEHSIENILEKTESSNQYDLTPV